MKILHTSDWHVGRAVRGGISRDDEHRKVLGEIVNITKAENVDLVLIAGDVFDHVSPSASAEDIVFETLLALAETGAQIVMIAGNHDHPDRLEAIRPLLKLANVHVGAKYRLPEDGGCIDVLTRSGEVARIVLAPWLPRSKAVTVDDLMGLEQAQHQQAYIETWRETLLKLCSGFSASTVNLVLAHVAVTGSQLGGGERLVEVTEDYWVDLRNLNLKAHYAAFGHIHMYQNLNLDWQACYSGSPLQLDFGEEKDTKGVLLVEAEPGYTKSVRTPRFVELHAGRRMVTLHGTLAQLQSRADANNLGDAYLRVFVSEPARVGLADEVREILLNAVEVKIDAPSADGPQLTSREGLQPRELMAAYFDQANVKDESVLKLFDELMEAENAAAPA